MFQPMPTPFASFYTTYGVANANIPDYTFASTPLGQGGRGSGGRSNSGSQGTGSGIDAGALDTLDPNAANIFISPIFQHSLDHNQNHHNHAHANLHHLSYNKILPHHEHDINHDGHARHRSNHIVKMEQQSDLAQQEVAARDYEPELEGPKVGDKTPSHAITEEYAKADPTYVAKTMVSNKDGRQTQAHFHQLRAPWGVALPRTYSHYRPIQGDGNCGWRAIGFGYFESLIRCGDIAQLQAEATRLLALNSFLETAGGYSSYVFEDFTDATFELLTEITQAVTSGQDAVPILLSKFNDEASSAPIIYHLRLLTASQLKGNFAEYQPFVPGDVNSYCDEWILPVNREIDHLGIVLLFNVLLRPANIVLEIAYLDRSEGDEVNVHRMPDEANSQDHSTLGPMIHLLYRPGHYDILYRDAIAPSIPEPPIESAALQVNRVASFSHQHDIRSSVSSLQNFSTLNMSSLAMIPGFDSVGLSPLASPPPASSPLADGYSPSPQSPWMQQSFSDGLPPAPSHIASQPSPPQQQQQPSISSLTSLRFSKYNVPIPGTVDSGGFSSEPTFTTNMFKHSHFNTAHYNNPHFQPEEYRPGYDDEIPATRSGGRKRST